MTVECGGTSEDTPKLAKVKEFNNFGDDAKEPKYCIISLELLLPIKLCYVLRLRHFWDLFSHFLKLPIKLPIKLCYAPHDILRLRRDILYEAY